MIAVYIHPNGMTLAQYQDAEAQLEAIGMRRPAGMIHHSCFGPDGDLMVYDIWESAEAFEEFGQTLMPIVAKAGIDIGEPHVMPLHQLIQQARG